MMINGTFAESAELIYDVLHGGVFISFFHKQAKGDIQD